MSKITTDDCKKYLVDFYNEKGTATLAKDWKRTKKYKNNDDLWVRDFNHATIGNVSLLEDSNGVLSIDSSNPSATKPVATIVTTSKIFDLTIFTESQIKEAWQAYKAYYDDCEDEDEFVAIHDKSIRLIPSILSWYVSPEAYENYELKPKKMSWDFNMKGYNIYMFDHKNYHEYGGDQCLLDKYLPVYFDKCDEYHYEIQDDITVEQLVRDLSAFGYSHTNSHVGEKCVLSGLMKTAVFNKVPFKVSKLEMDILLDNIQGYTREELSTQKVNNQSVPFFAFENGKLDVFNYLVEKKVDISNADLSALIRRNIFDFDKSPEKLDALLRVVLEYDTIKLDNDRLHTLVFNLTKNNQQEPLYALFNKYINDDNSLIFASSEILIKDKSVIRNFVSRFSNHDEELTHWISSHFVYSEKLDILSHKEIRDAIGRDYITSILNDIHSGYLESLQYEIDRERGGMMIVSVKHDGTQESWGQQKAKNLAKFISSKNKIMAYFNRNDDDDTPKVKYRTKF